MKRKRIRLKKEFKMFLVIIFAIIMVGLIAKSIYNDHVYKNSYEYKLEVHGYEPDEVKLLMDNLDNKKLDDLLLSKIDETMIKLLKEEYYIKDNLDEYLAYIEKNKKESLSNVIKIVNTHTNYEYYTHDIEADVSKDKLILCNKYYKLSKDYEPDDIVEMDNKYYYGDIQRVRENLYEAFIDMWNAANEEGIYLIVNSSYRSYQDQEETFNYYKETYGEKYADSIAARPGYSEHQTGLSVDIFSKGNTSKATFKESNAYAWLEQHAHEYGFILRYPEGKEDLTGYDAESWHYRYVGKKVAKKLKESGLTYDEYYAYFVEK